MPGALFPEASPISKAMKLLRKMTQRLTLFHFHFADRPNVETRPSLCDQITKQGCPFIHHSAGFLIIGPSSIPQESFYM